MVKRLIFIVTTVSVFALCVNGQVQSNVSSTKLLIPFRVGDKFGFCDIAKRIIIPPKYDNAFPFSEGLAVVVINGKAGYIDRMGRIVIPLQYRGAASFENGLALVSNEPPNLIPYTTPTDSFPFGGRYINREGKTVFSPSYTFRSSGFQGGIAIFSLSDGREGVINRDGRILMSPNYHVSFINGHDGIVSTSEFVDGKDVLKFMKETGEVILSLPSAGSAHTTFINGLAAICLGRPRSALTDRCRFIDLTGTTIISEREVYDVAFEEGLLATQDHGQIEIIDTSGNTVMNLKYDDIRPYFDGLAAIARNNKWGYIDKKGKEVITLKFDEPGVFTNGLARVVLNKKEYYIDKNGVEYYDQRTELPNARGIQKIGGYIDLVEVGPLECKLRIIAADKIYSGLITFSALATITKQRINSFADAVRALSGKEVILGLAGVTMSGRDGNFTFGNINQIAFVTSGSAGQPMQTLTSRKMEKETIVDLSTDILFDFDKAIMKPAALPLLIKLAALIRESSQSMIQLNGFTDSKGNDAYNLDLSERRAEAVKQWLVLKAGIDARQLKIKGYGKNQPVEPNTKPDGTDNPDGRQKNRRVEVRIPRG
jgi:outer membrane protein OmpA-like peptidoglycan-associated protein